jgi:tRNA threonylcarbamoyladenosine biosynthesis protein TsaB
MVFLSIDTCGPIGTVALARVDGESVTQLGQTDLPGKTYSAELVPSIAELLKQHIVAVADLAAIVVTSGPGSFTGIRIGLSAAKGLAEANATPILAVSRLAVLAHKTGTQAAAMDASRSEFYLVDFSANSTERLVTRDQFEETAATLGPRLTVCEPSAHALAPRATLVPPPTALDALHYALPRLQARAFDDPATLDGNYLRRSDAEIFAKHQQ